MWDLSCLACIYSVIADDYAYFLITGGTFRFVQGCVPLRALNLFDLQSDLRGDRRSMLAVE